SGRHLPLETTDDLPDADETVELLLPKFTYFGFQFLRIEGAVLNSDRTDADTALPTLVAVMADFTTSSTEQVGTFRCSNTLVNEIDKMIERSVRSNLQSVLTDCPHREKLGWLEVAHLMGPSIMSRFDVQNLYRKICRDTTESQLENGLVPDIAPEYTRFSAGFFESPEWGSASVLLPSQLFHTYGDRQIVRQQMETMERYVDYLASTRNEQGLVKAGLGDWYDWSPEKGHAGYSQHTPGELTATAMLYMCANALAEFYDVADSTIDRYLQYFELADQVRDDFIKAYYKPDGTVSTGSQAAQAMAIAGLYWIIDAAEEQLIKKLSEANNRPTVGEVVFRYLISALSDMNRDDIVWDIITGTKKPGYGYMLKEHGMKTLSETWDGPGSSMNHCMFGHAQEWFMCKVAGIDLASIDLELSHTVRIYPRLVGVVSDLTSAEGSWLGPYGKIVSTWEITGDKVRYHIEVPPGLTATLILLHPLANVRCDGMSIAENEENGFVWRPHAYNEAVITILTVPSGTYDFETDWKPGTK
ncbi:MAG: hypothetical protein FWH27_14855, partial [Planctomycetaceae bacterium]|nr:hypothetical protein [Planctomycetaceae bacterium]